MKKPKENSNEGLPWSEMGKQNVQAEKVYYRDNFLITPNILSMFCDIFTFFRAVSEIKTV